MKIVDVVCWKCKRKVGEEMRKSVRKNPIDSKKMCGVCYKNHLKEMKVRERSDKRRNENSNRMKKENPMFLPAVRAKVASTNSGEEKSVEDYVSLKKDRIRESKGELIHRMKTNNPAHMPGVRDKIRKTIKKKIESGELVYKRGPEHHLWKGTGDFSKLCRSNLRTIWVQPILERDNFKCLVCGNTKELHVHHIYPLRDIITKVLTEHDVDDINTFSYDECLPLVEEVVLLHTLDIGITVCIDCHEEIDPFFKRRNFYKPIT